MGKLVQSCKCAIWSPFNLPLSFSPQTKFYTLENGIRVLGVPFGLFAFASFFIQEVLDEDVWHVQLFLPLKDV
jgi:hypothetical protein